MLMPMMYIRRVRMSVFQWNMLMDMGVRLSLGIGPLMRMLVVPIVNVGVRMPHDLMDVFMVVAFGKVQPYADAHEHTGSPELRCRRFT
jgi:hypothetical protein